MNEEIAKRRVNRKRSAALKAQVLTQCKVSGASVASIAKANDLAASLVNKWIRKDRAIGKTQAAEFVKIPIVDESRAVCTDQIRVEINRGALRMTIDWPASTANTAAAWLHRIVV
jgi:transposase